MQQNYSTKIEEIALKLATENGKVTTSEITKQLKNKITRQYTHSIIQKLLEEKKLIKGNQTRNAFYVLPQNAAKKIDLIKISKTVKNKDLKEHEILDEILSNYPLQKSLNENLKSIFSYAFSEMLNNAIDHSESKKIQIEVVKDTNKLTFQIIDQGIGVFNNIIKVKKLATPIEAIQELLKGKTTTNPKAHSGEGIFFTSKIADSFKLESYEHSLLIDNTIKDLFIGKTKNKIKGTIVTFQINLKSKNTLNTLFRKYQSDPENYAFDQTEINVKLYTLGTIHVSRSQARRVLTNLKKFNSIILDFDQVPLIGQAFADEIFRVFKNQNPQLKITTKNTNDAVDFMIKRVAEN